MPSFEYPANFIRFLGTAGTRFIMLSQRRSSGGIWFSYGGARGVIDPGPGSLVRICEARPSLSLYDINTIILTHRHIDHSSDVNALAEGMILKSRAPRGFILATRDALEDGDRVIMRYLLPGIAVTAIHEDGKFTSPIGGVTIESVRHSHNGVECYGCVFRADGLPSWGVISDTAPMPGFPSRYGACELLIVNTALMFPRANEGHMSLPDVESLLARTVPAVAAVTHMGADMLDKGAEYISRRFSARATKMIAAEDGMILTLENPITILKPERVRQSFQEK
ncbi:MAG: MBL fold metallo-hydrolase [Synergistaceae bacterium]|jgi:phosphoribosyl 1,2-cyclic phosphodiesterase|nr:MBL fold metallo-hydrolase [Synergistaceae bacterium]